MQYLIEMVFFAGRKSATEADHAPGSDIRASTGRGRGAETGAVAQPTSMGGATARVERETTTIGDDFK